MYFFLREREALLKRVMTDNVESFFVIGRGVNYPEHRVASIESDRVDFNYVTLNTRSIDKAIRAMLTKGPLIELSVIHTHPLVILDYLNQSMGWKIDQANMDMIKKLISEKEASVIFPPSLPDIIGLWQMKIKGAVSNIGEYYKMMKFVVICPFATWVFWPDSYNHKQLVKLNSKKAEIDGIFNRINSLNNPTQESRGSLEELVKRYKRILANSFVGLEVIPHE